MGPRYITKQTVALVTRHPVRYNCIERGLMRPNLLKFSNRVCILFLLICNSCHWKTKTITIAFLCYACHLSAWYIFISPACSNLSVLGFINSSTSISPSPSPPLSLYICITIYITLFCNMLQLLFYLLWYAGKVNHISMQIVLSKDHYIFLFEHMHGISAQITDGISFRNSSIPGRYGNDFKIIINKLF